MIEPIQLNAETPAELWQCSPMLRWRKSSDPIRAMMEAMGSAPRVLQQLWSEKYTGKQEWRDVPEEQP